MPNFTEEEKTQLDTLKQLVTDFVKNIKSSIDKNVGFKKTYTGQEAGYGEEWESPEQTAERLNNDPDNTLYTRSYSAWVELIAIFNLLDGKNTTEATREHLDYLRSLNAQNYTIADELKNSYYTNDKYAENGEYSLIKLVEQIVGSYNRLHKSLQNKTANAGVLTTLFNPNHGASIKKEVELLKAFRKGIQDFCKNNGINCLTDNGKLSVSSPLRIKSARK